MQQDIFAPPREAELTQLDSVQKEIQKRSFFDKPLVGAEYTSKDEIQKIAARHGVDAEELEKLAPYFGARLEGSSFASPEEFKRAVGGIGQILLNVPQKAYKRYRGGEMERALDELQNLALGRQSYLQFAGEVAAPVGTIRAATTAGKIAAGAGVGAVAGYSSAGQEQGTTGALVGAGLGGALGAVTSRLAKRVDSPNINKAEKETAENYLLKNTAEIEDGTQEILSRRAQSEDDISRMILSESDLDMVAADRLARQQLDPEHIATLTNSANSEGKLFLNKVARNRPEQVQELGLKQAAIQELAEDIVERRARDFAADITGERPKSLDEARRAIQEYASREGQEATANRYKIFTEEQAAMDYIHQAGIRMGRGDNFGDKALNFISDAQFVLSDIDERFGINLELAHQRLNIAYNRLSFARNEMRENISNIYQAHKAIDDELVRGGRVYRALDTGDTTGLTAQERSAYESFKQYFKDSVNYVNNLVKQKDPNIAPMSIATRENYVPHILLAPEELSKRFNQVYQEALKAASERNGRQITDLTQLSKSEFRQTAAERPELRQFIAGLNTFDNTEIKTPQEAMLRFKDLLQSRAGLRKMETMAKAALERQGNIPDWMREKNLYKLADRWASNTLKHLYLRNQIDQMKSIAKRVEAAGGDLEADYINRLLQDIQGIRKGTAAELGMQGAIKYQTKIDELTEGRGKVAEAAGAVAKALPEIIADMNRQIYPNLLGMSPRALIMNLTQPIVKTAPELGNQYGYTAVFRGALNAAANYTNYVNKIKEKGFQPADFVRKYSRYMANDIRRNALYAIPNEIANIMGDAAMFLYTKTDTINRAITAATADVMANDIMRGSKLATNALDEFPKAIRNAAKRAKSKEELSDILGTHLNARTQYNYNRLSLSEFGRTMGPYFSVFSKWPTATAGDIINDARNKGALKAGTETMTKYIAPLMLLQSADILMFGYDPDKPWQENEDNKSDIAKKLFGRAGLSQSAPLGSVEGIITGDFWTPPAIDAAMKGLVIPTMQGDTGKLAKGLDTTVNNFAPGSVWVRFLTDDLVTYSTGERPEGSTFTERTASGLEHWLDKLEGK